MYCKSCGNKLSDNDKFCAICGTKNELQENIVQIDNVKEPKYNKFLSNKVMLFMFLINYILCIILSINDPEMFKGGPLLNIIFALLILGFCFLIINPFLLIALILSILNIKKYSIAYVIGCLICSVLMFFPILFINTFLAFGKTGIFSSTITTWIFLIQSLLVIVTCLLKLIFKVKN